MTWHCGHFIHSAGPLISKSATLVGIMGAGDIWVSWQETVSCSVTREDHNSGKSMKSNFRESDLNVAATRRTLRLSPAASCAVLVSDATCMRYSDGCRRIHRVLEITAARCAGLKKSLACLGGINVSFTSAFIRNPTSKYTTSTREFAIILFLFFDERPSDQFKFVSAICIQGPSPPASVPRARATSAKISLAGKGSKRKTGPCTFISSAVLVSSPNSSRTARIVTIPSIHEKTRIYIPIAS
jgi:hypothetical protein